MVHYRGVDYPCRAHDVSRTGAMLRGGIPWPNAPTVDFTLASPGHDLSVRLEGRVVRIGPGPDGDETLLGVEFQDPSPADRAEVEALLSRLLEDPLESILAALPKDAAPGKVRETLDTIPEPHRIALASHADRTERDRLAHDRSPRVQEALARNPNQTPPELLALATRPNLQPSTLELLARIARDRRDEELRHRVLGHRRVPPTLVRTELDRMDVAEARRLAARSGLPASLRTELARRARGH